MLRVISTFLDDDIGVDHYKIPSPIHHTYFCKNNDYYCSDNIKHCSADNTYCFTPIISNGNNIGS